MNEVKGRQSRPLSVEEMIDNITIACANDEHVVSFELRRAIVEALRAGQAFRARCRCMQPQMSGYVPYCANTQDTTEFVRAWDAATGGGE